MGDWEMVWDWVMNLSTDDLQRYGIVGDRGADPRLDIPADYPDRAEALEKVFRLGLFMRGVEAAGDQTEWLLTHPNRDDGALAFARASSDGPDWGFIPLEDVGSLDDPACNWIPGYKYTRYYYLYRTGGQSNGTVFDWSDPVGAEDNRRIMANGEVRTYFPSSAEKICHMYIVYESATTLDGRFLNGETVEATRNGWHTGFSTGTGLNIRGAGLPDWHRDDHPDCFPTGIDCDAQGNDCLDWGGVFINQGEVVSPLPKYLARYAGTSRYRDYFKTPCTAWECDSCWYLSHDHMTTCAEGECCWRGALNEDLCFYTTGTHQAASWDHGDYPNDDEEYYYTGPGNSSFDDGVISRRVEYLPNALVATVGDTYGKGGWMNQVVYWSDGTYVDDDQVVTPDASASTTGNSQFIKRVINVDDSASWLGHDLTVGCRPFWRWNIYRSGSVLPYYLQLATAGDQVCNTVNGYNRWDIDEGNNPIYCFYGWYGGSITYDASNADHRPWEVHYLLTPGWTQNDGGRGWLHPSQCFVRQNPGDDCQSPTVFNVTYFPLQTKLADVNYPGTYLQVITKTMPW